MTNILPAFLLLFAIASAQAAQKSRTPAQDNSKPERTVYNNKKMHAPPRPEYTDFSVGLIVWQEDVKASRASESTLMQTQFSGVNLGMSWNKFFKREWRTWHTVDLTLGTAKGKGQTTAIPDELKRQTFLMLEGQPGVMWRTSPVSELGFALPIAFRYIKWDLINGAGLNMDKKTSFSIGVGATYVNRLSARNSIHVSVAHQHMWASTLITISFNRSL